VRRGEIYWADLSQRSGSEQRGRRPVLVVSHDGFNQTPGWRSIIVVPLSTSATQAKRGPTAVLMPRGSGGLTKASVALCHQVTTLDRSRLTDAIGLISSSLLRQISTGLRAAMDLETAR
jgi:mRNA interferase MazF